MFNDAQTGIEEQGFAERIDSEVHPGMLQRAGKACDCGDNNRRLGMVGSGDGGGKWPFGCWMERGGRRRVSVVDFGSWRMFKVLGGA